MHSLQFKLLLILIANVVQFLIDIYAVWEYLVGYCPRGKCLGEMLGECPKAL